MGVALQLQSLLHWLHHRDWSAGMGQCTIEVGVRGATSRVCHYFSVLCGPEWDGLLSFTFTSVCHMTKGLRVWTRMMVAMCLCVRAIRGQHCRNCCCRTLQDCRSAASSIVIQAHCWRRKVTAVTKVQSSKELCWATVPQRDYSREIGDEGGGRAEVRHKEHQVSAAISFAGSAAPPSVKVCAGELQISRDVVRLRMCCRADFFPQTHIQYSGEKSKSKGNALDFCQSNSRWCFFNVFLQLP